MGPNTFSSYILAKLINTKYHIIRIIPYFRSSFQPFKWVATTKNTTVDSKDNVEYVKPEKKRCISTFDAI